MSTSNGLLKRLLKYWLKIKIEEHNFTMITIDLLKNNPTAIHNLVQIWLATLGNPWMPDIPAATIEVWMSEWLNDDIPPLAFIALDGDKSVGMCSLQMNDGIRPDLFPWLGDVCVDPEYQNRGIGKLLVNAAINKTREMGFKNLYLFIFEDALVKYYQKFGWQIIGNDEYEGHSVIVMALSLQYNR